jgi:hypothetical protein
VSTLENNEAPAKPLALAVLTDVHFWVPFVVLLLGIAVLAVCAQS